MRPEEYYTRKRVEIQGELQSIKKKRNGITLGKIGLFIGICTGLYFFATTAAWQILAALGCGVVLFIVLSVWDNKVVVRIRECGVAMLCCETELSYLKGDCSGLATGSEYRQADHPYAIDLDILGENSLFQHINRTITAEGKTKLAGWLLAPSRTSQEIRERQTAVEELAGIPDWCNEFRVKGMLYAAAENISVDLTAWLNAPPYFLHSSVWTCIYISNILTWGAWIAVLFSWIPFLFALILSLAQLGWVNFHSKRMRLYNKQLDGFMRMTAVYLHLIRHMEGISFQSKRLADLKQGLTGKNQNALKAFAALNDQLNHFEQRGNFLANVLLNGLYTHTFYAIRDLDRWKKRYGSSVLKWVETVHEADALVSMAVYRFNHPQYIVPLLKTDDKWLLAEEAGHPLLGKDGGIKNDFSVQEMHQFFIITGANMAGKSTFLRTIGVNLVLALSGNVVCSRKFEFSLMELFTSMRTTDNLARGTSYFHAELLRLKQLVEQAEQTDRLFIILDEMLKGTNSEDKLYGSLKFLERLLQLPVSGIVATHDLALGELAEKYPDHFQNYCFEITPTHETIHYDYKLKAGISRNMNASLLLRKMGLIR